MRIFLSFYVGRKMLTMIWYVCLPTLLCERHHHHGVVLLLYDNITSFNHRIKIKTDRPKPALNLHLRLSLSVSLSLSPLLFPLNRFIIVISLRDIHLLGYLIVLINTIFLLFHYTRYIETSVVSSQSLSSLSQLSTMASRRKVLLKVQLILSTFLFAVTDC